MSQRELFSSLTGLRFILALWISVYHLIKLYGPVELASAWYVELGNARVDVFFLLSGFVLAHVYRSEALDFGSFLKARIARLYPLHLLGLGILLAGVAAAVALGRAEEAGAYTPLGFLASVLMLQSWGVPGAAQWNFPTWTLSAEMSAYLIFPALVWLGARLQKRPGILMIAALALTGCADGIWAVFSPHSPLSEASQVLGSVRGALVFAVGFATRAAFDSIRLSGRAGAVVALGGALLAGAAALSSWPLVVVAAGAAGLVVGVASIDRAGSATPLSGPVMQTLGGWSYALFVLHVPIFILGTRAMSVAGWDGRLGFVSGGVLLGVALLASWPTHLLIEEPARRAIRSLRFSPAATRRPAALSAH